MHFMYENILTFKNGRDHSKSQASGIEHKNAAK